MHFLLLSVSIDNELLLPSFKYPLFLVIGGRCWLHRQLHALSTKKGMVKFIIGAKSERVARPIPTIKQSYYYTTKSILIECTNSKEARSITSERVCQGVAIWMNIWRRKSGRNEQILLAQLPIL